MNESYERYDSGRARIGDAIVYGTDLNGDGVLGGFVEIPNPSNPRMVTPVAEIQHSAVVTKVVNGEAVLAESVMGPNLVEHSPFHDKVMREYPCPNPYGGSFGQQAVYQMYHLKKGANPGRVWRP